MNDFKYQFLLPVLPLLLGKSLFALYKFNNLGRRKFFGVYYRLSYLKGYIISGMYEIFLSS